MRGKRKPFDREESVKWDAAAKDAVASHLSYHGYDVKVPPENYGADLFHRHPHLPFTVNHEVEVSNGWGDAAFPFKTGSVPERKIRLCKMTDGPLFFWMLNCVLNRAVVFSSEYLKPIFLVEVSNTKIKSGEFFYRIPLKYGRMIDPLMKGE
jgi:hypothetical protein